MNVDADTTKYAIESIFSLQDRAPTGLFVLNATSSMDESLRWTTSTPQSSLSQNGFQTQANNYFNDCSYPYAQNGSSAGCQTSEGITLHQLIMIFFGVLFVLIFFFGLFTNAIVIVVFVFKSELRQFTNYFFANLSISDILVLLICMPIAITDLFKPDSWYFGHFYCKFFYFIEYCVTSVSSLTIILISLERYAAISKPLYVKHLFNEKNSLVIIILIWIFGSIISVPFLFIAEYYENPKQCIFNLTHNFLVYLLVINFTLIFVPTVCLAFLYTYIIVKLRNHSKLFREKPSSMTSGTTNEDGLRLNFKQPICYYFDKNRKQLVQHYPEEHSQLKPNSSLSHHLSEERSSGSVNKCKRTSCPVTQVTRMSAANGQMNTTRYYPRTNTFNTISSNLNRHSMAANTKYSTSHCTFKRNKSTNSCVLCFSTLTNKIECKCKVRKDAMYLCCLGRRDSSDIGSNRTSVNGCSDIKTKAPASYRFSQADPLRVSLPEGFITPTLASKSSKYQITDQERRPTQYSLRRELNRSKLKFTIVISMVTLAFFCCQLPVRIFVSWAYVKQYAQQHEPNKVQHDVKENMLLIDVCLNITKLIYFFHAISNPIIYNILSSKFRKAFISLTTFKKTRLFQFSFRMPNRI